MAVRLQRWYIYSAMDAWMAITVILALELIIWAIIIGVFANAIIGEAFEWCRRRIGGRLP